MLRSPQAGAKELRRPPIEFMQQTRGYAGTHPPPSRNIISMTELAELAIVRQSEQWVTIVRNNVAFMAVKCHSLAVSCGERAE